MANLEMAKKYPFATISSIMANLEMSMNIHLQIQEFISSVSSFSLLSPMSKEQVQEIYFFVQNDSGN